jgi:hypothetical protein
MKTIVDKAEQLGRTEGQATAITERAITSANPASTMRVGVSTNQAA